MASIAKTSYRKVTMNRRNVFKMLAAVPFLGIKGTELKKDWLLVNPTQRWPEVDFTSGFGEFIKAGTYSKFFMRFSTQIEAASFKSKLMPTNSKEFVGTPNGKFQGPYDNKVVVRSGYRGAIRGLYKAPDNIAANQFDWTPDRVTLVCVENNEAYDVVPRMRFPDFAQAWDFIDSLVIKEDDGESYSWQRLIQPFRRNKEAPEFYV